uniref:ATP synthase complex subunit 8 n=1 Tax=Semidalis aleyrodiformis TaxID=450889 RepID=A0A1S5QXX2_9NEOP|nr:ATP synthase F0 subunit 8 [Semidalis aleyrodiformis]
MPQMAPMNWILLFLMSILMFYLFSNLNYFINYKPADFKNMNNIKINKNLWKW